MATQWWIKSGSKVSKPLTPEQVQKLFKENRIPADALFSRDGKHWDTAQKLQANSRNASPTCKAAFRCPHCEVSIKHQHQFAGKVVSCPQCKLPFRVPSSVTAGTVAEPVSPNPDSNKKSDNLAPEHKSTKNRTPSTRTGSPFATLDAKSGTGRLDSLGQSEKKYEADVLKKRSVFRFLGGVLLTGCNYSAATAGVALGLVVISPLFTKEEVKPEWLLAVPLGVAVFIGFPVGIVYGIVRGISGLDPMQNKGREYVKSRGAWHPFFFGVSLRKMGDEMYVDRRIMELEQEPSIAKLMEALRSDADCAKGADSAAVDILVRVHGAKAVPALFEIIKEDAPGAVAAVRAIGEMESTALIALPVLNSALQAERRKGFFQRRGDLINEIEIAINYLTPVHTPSLDEYLDLVTTESICRGDKGNRERYEALKRIRDFGTPEAASALDAAIEFEEQQSFLVRDRKFIRMAKKLRESIDGVAD